MGVGHREVLVDLVDHRQAAVAHDLGHEARGHPPAELLGDEGMPEEVGVDPPAEDVLAEVAEHLLNTALGKGLEVP